MISYLGFLVSYREWKSYAPDLELTYYRRYQIFLGYTFLINHSTAVSSILLFPFFYHLFHVNPVEDICTFRIRCSLFLVLFMRRLLGFQNLEGLFNVRLHILPRDISFYFERN